MASKSTMPPPPPFYQLYSFPPPPPPPTAGVESLSAAERARRVAAAEERAIAAARLPLDIYQPPPPLQEAFIKFGEIQPAGYMLHELGPDVPQLFVTHSSAAASVAAAGTTATAASSSDATASAVPAAASASSSAAATAATVATPAGLPVPPAVNYTASLRMLNRQYLQAYLAVLSALTTAAPAPAGASSADLSSGGGGLHVQHALKRLADIGANMSWLLTQLRPHQALQTIVQLVMKQIDKRKKKTQHVKSCIADAKAFLAAHGVHYAEGSTNVIPDTDITAAMASSFASSSSSAAAAATTAAISAAAATNVKAEDSDRMDIDGAPAAQSPTAAVKQENKAAASASSTSAASSLSAATPPPLDPAAQLRAFLDGIPDD